MARSHHRKKHKQHLQQFKHSHDITTTKSKGKASMTFLFAGIVVGFAIGFFASNGSPAWTAISAALGGISGFLIGRRLDSEK